MLATLTSVALVGIDAVPVQVEVNANERGEPRLILLGLPDAAVKESANRIHSALAHCGFAALRTRTTVNLAPGSLRKEGALYDLPIALALLATSRQLQLEIADDCLIAGELSLSHRSLWLRRSKTPAILISPRSKASERCAARSRWPAAAIIICSCCVYSAHFGHFSRLPRRRPESFPGCQIRLAPRTHE